MTTMPQMKYHFAVKLRIFPSSSQKRIISFNSEANRFFYNKLVGLNKELSSLRSVTIFIQSVQNRIDFITNLLHRPVVNISNLYPRLNQPKIDSDMKNTCLKNYKQAWLFVQRSDKWNFPKYHHKKWGQRYQTSNHYSHNKDSPHMWNGSLRLVDSKHIHVNKLGKVKIAGLPIKILKWSHQIRMGTATISKDATGNYYVAIQLATNQNINSADCSKKHIGIDLNTKNFLTTSDNEVVDTSGFYNCYANRLTAKQRILNRRRNLAIRRGQPLARSKNYQKQRIEVAKLHQKIANKRLNHLHQLSSIFINKYSFIGAENLTIKSMLHKHIVSSQISDAGWGIFLEQLAYKAELYNRTFITVDPAYTTQTCSQCLNVLSEKERLTGDIRAWTCPKCHYRHSRDHNAAKNILRKAEEKHSITDMLND